MIVISAQADAQSLRALTILSGADAAQSEAVLLEVAHTNLAASAALALAKSTAQTSGEK